jgi:histidinol-phosphate aminotransferase
LAGLAALEDQAWIDRVREHTITWRRWTTDALRKVGLDVPDSVGNFVLCRFPGVADADTADAFLRCRGLIARKIGAYGLGGSLRITIGTEEEMRLLADGLAGYQSKQQRQRAH